MSHDLDLMRFDTESPAHHVSAGVAIAEISTEEIAYNEAEGMDNESPAAL